ncbi:MAG: hypothetical protein AB7K64_22280 [Variibacter sp.]
MTSIKGLLSRLHMLRRTVADAWHWRHELVNLSDSWQCSPAEADRLARDVGLQPADIAINQRAALWSLLRAPRDIVGIDPHKRQAAAPEYAPDRARVSLLFDS